MYQLSENVGTNNVNQVNHKGTGLGIMSLHIMAMLVKLKVCTVPLCEVMNTYTLQKS